MGRRPRGSLSYEMRCPEEMAEEHKARALERLWDGLRQQMGPGNYLLHLSVHQKLDPRYWGPMSSTLVWAEAHWVPEPAILLTDAPQECFALLVDGPVAGKRLILPKVMPSLLVPVQTEDLHVPAAPTLDRPSFRMTSARYELRNAIADVLHYHHAP